MPIQLNTNKNVNQMPPHSCCHKEDEDYLIQRNSKIRAMPPIFLLSAREVTDGLLAIQRLQEGSQFSIEEAILMNMNSSNKYEVPTEMKKQLQVTVPESNRGPFLMAHINTLVPYRLFVEFLKGLSTQRRASIVSLCVPNGFSQ